MRSCSIHGLNRVLVPALLVALCVLGRQAPAATPDLAGLLRPAGIRDVRISPSGSRVAALVQGSSSDSDLLVLEERRGKLSSLLATHLAAPDAVASYQWLSDDYLAIYYASADQEFTQFAIGDIPHHSIDVQDQFTRIVKAPWSDDAHILVSATGARNCSSHTVSRCLLVLDIRSNNSKRISDPFTQLPVTFLAISATEIYASGRDGHDRPHDFQLDASNGKWKPVADGTLQLRRREQQQQAPLPAEVQQQQARAGMPGSVPVWTEPDHHLVGLEGIAPQRAFLALDSRLDGVQALLEQQYPEARARLTGLNADLTRGMIRISGPDQPPLYLFYNETGSLTQYAQLEPQLSPAALGRTHIERDWVSDMPVAVTMPPQGTTPIGTVIEPVIATVRQSEEPLLQYDGMRQALAQAGIVVVQASVVIPASFDTPAAGGDWRQAQADRLRTVIGRVRTELAVGKPVCLYGENLAATLSLAWAAADQVDCTVAVGARLDPAAYTHPIIIVRAEGARVVRRDRMIFPAMPGEVQMAASAQQLHRDLPAEFGVSGSEQLLDPTRWVPHLPSNLMLAYDMLPRVQQEFAAEAREFRGAVQSSGRHLDFYSEESVSSDDIQSRDRLLQAVIDYLQRNMTTAASSSVARSP